VDPPELLPIDHDPPEPPPVDHELPEPPLPELPDEL
jgi:hypothetical protein